MAGWGWDAGEHRARGSECIRKEQREAPQRTPYTYDFSFSPLKNLCHKKKWRAKCLTACPLCAPFRFLETSVLKTEFRHRLPGWAVPLSLPALTIPSVLPGLGSQPHNIQGRTQLLQFHSFVVLNCGKGVRLVIPMSLSAYQDQVRTGSAWRTAPAWQIVNIQQLMAVVTGHPRWVTGEELHLIHECRTLSVLLHTFRVPETLHLKRRH